MDVDIIPNSVKVYRLNPLLNSLQQIDFNTNTLNFCFLYIVWHIFANSLTFTLTLFNCFKCASYTEYEVGCYCFFNPV